MKRLLLSSTLLIALAACTEQAEVKEETQAEAPVEEKIEISELIGSSTSVDTIGDSIVERSITADTVINGDDTIITMKMEEIMHHAPDQEKVDSIKQAKKKVKKRLSN